MSVLELPPMPPKAKYVPPSREGKVPMTFYVDPTIRKAVKLAAITNDMTVDAMMQEAVTAILKSYRAKPKS